MRKYNLTILFNGELGTSFDADRLEGDPGIFGAMDACQAIDTEMLNLYGNTGSMPVIEYFISENVGEFKITKVGKVSDYTYSETFETEKQAAANVDNLLLMDSAIGLDCTDDCYYISEVG